MQIQENISLKPFNTFNIDVKARYFSSFSSSDELNELIEANSRLSKLILGGGSNILFTKNVDGLVLKNEIRGIQELHEDNEYVYVKVGAGENWHQFVLHCIQRNWCGIENLSLIPGNVGAAPIQNIGAYGVELKEVFYDLEAFHLKEKKNCRFSLNDCAFGYRTSVFKEKFKDQFVILHITLRLRKHPVLNTSYGAISQELEKMGVKEPTIKNLSQAVISIRSSKLPDPEKIPNAGSFFKNPVVSGEKFQKLKSKFPHIVGYENRDGTVKLAAGWLIEHCGPAENISWKGYKKGAAGCHQDQALVLVNHGQANGREIFDLSEEILNSVADKYDVKLEREVNVF